MRHSNRVKKFGRKRNQRVALMRSLAESLFRCGRIRTTEAKAKALRPLVERIITLSRLNTPAARRLIRARLKNDGNIPNLYKKIAPRYAARAGGYTRVVKVGPRFGDGAKMAIIELV